MTAVSVRDYLLSMSQLTASGDDELAYTSPYDFVLAEGVAMPYSPVSRDWNAGMSTPYAVKWGQPNFCFANSLLAALTQDDLRYVEGYAAAADKMPVQHAWCIDDSGIVHDFTWGDGDGPTGVREYIGVVFPLEVAVESVWVGEDSCLWPHYNRLAYLNESWTHDGRRTAASQEWIDAAVDSMQEWAQGAGHAIDVPF